MSGKQYHNDDIHWESTYYCIQTLTSSISTTSLVNWFLKGWRYAENASTFFSRSLFTFFSCPNSAAREHLSFVNCWSSFSIVWQCRTMLDNASWWKLIAVTAEVEIDDFADLGDNNAGDKAWLLLRREVWSAWYSCCCCWSLESDDAVFPSESIKTLTCLFADSGCKNSCVIWWVIGHGELQLSNSSIKVVFNCTVKLMLEQQQE